ncbi:MAG: hypothetical protein KatS3mg108_2822 [Isosphaeraceae bacterium]|jgi:hypothetical protein|nr:MAG: hypothetical protein KatS3mg108_2822 [Isosphaeraceae bacterium]
MGFLDGLKALLGGRGGRDAAERRRLARLWGLDEESAGERRAEPKALDLDALPPIPRGRGVASAYDERMWVKKLRYLLSERLPIPDEEWEDFRADALALGFDESWIREQEREAFGFLLRKVVRDGVVSERERQELEWARRQIGLSEQEATEMLEAVVREAEAELGRTVDGV